MVQHEDIGRQRRRRRLVPLGLLLGLSSFVIGVAIGDSTRPETAQATARPETSSTTTTTITPTTSTPATTSSTSSSTTTTSTTAPPPPIDETAPLTAVVATRTDLRVIDTRTGEQIGEPLDSIERLRTVAGASRFGRITLGADGYVYYAALREEHVGSTFRVRVDGTEVPERVAPGVSPARQAIGDLLATVGPPSDPKLIITDVTGKLETQIIPGRNSERHLHPTWAPEGRFLIIELLDADDTSRLVNLRSGDDQYPTIASAVPITRSTGIGWTSPHWRRRGEVVVIDQCCSMKSPGGAATNSGRAARRRVNPFQGNDTSVLASLPRPVVHHEYDASGDISLFVDDEGTLHWANDYLPEPAPDSAEADDDENEGEPVDQVPVPTGTIVLDEPVVAADW